MVNFTINEDILSPIKCLIEKHIGSVSKRYMSEINDVLNEVKDFTKTEDEIAYYMIREAIHEGDIQIFKDHDIRYDITIIPSKVFNGEYIKTLGHYHPLKENGDDSYSEYYEVLQGNALYLLQKVSQNNLLEFVVIKAAKGDKVYIPANYGHVTVNIGEEDLIMCNLVERNFNSIYEPVIKQKGFAYYCLKEEHSFKLIPNTLYEINAEPLVINANEWIQPIKDNKTLYELFIENPIHFSLLK